MSGRPAERCDERFAPGPNGRWLFLGTFNGGTASVYGSRVSKVAVVSTFRDGRALQTVVNQDLQLVYTDGDRDSVLAAYGTQQGPVRKLGTAENRFLTEAAQAAARTPRGGAMIALVAHARQLCQPPL